ncbi:hypothetical protein ACFQ48_18015 [Hymenobacter caeli]|uniref:Uncharacterized protein n=1 Tax=Hymenobacter caeli TaxID=2735894 RepID=A0ABX2FUP0_9BACT|nr:hypothetical protein [Hymenobacter caeli]NRT20896.1 hypothetical protein [Hymenobacter caeli]
MTAKLLLGLRQLITAGERTISCRVEFNALRTFQFGDTLLVIYDWMQFPQKNSIRNLYAYDAHGERLWIAEERRPGDFFTGFAGDGQSLKVTTWDCFCCILDPKTGKIINCKFVK